MEHISNARAVFRGMWRWPEVWALVIAGTVLMRLVFNSAFHEKMAEYNRSQIDVIKEQNQRSINDREYLHNELSNTKAALKRLERTVKTGEYP